jgi:hypothetical protein
MPASRRRHEASENRVPRLHLSATVSEQETCEGCCERARDRCRRSVRFNDDTRYNRRLRRDDCARLDPVAWYDACILYVPMPPLGHGYYADTQFNSMPALVTMLPLSNGAGARYDSLRSHHRACNAGTR